MKNNKGYTLVELLVTLAVFAIIMAEVGSMMMNSSRLYRNGTYEVELQTEAQQIVQQIQELMIDVTDSVSYNGSVSSSVITISNNDVSDNSVVYTLELKDVDPDRGYGTLYYSKAENGTTVVDEVMMAEYVQSISLNMIAYEFDVVTLNVSMNNGKYGYESSQDIYLRNGVGSGGGRNYAAGSSAEAELDVLRFKEYDLDDVLKDIRNPGETFRFTWDSDCAVEASQLYYHNEETGWIRASDGLNSNPNAVGPYVMKATSATRTIEIKIGSTKVGCGRNGSDLLFVNGTTASYAMMSPVIVHGVDITSSEITSFKITAVYMENPSTTREDELPSSAINPTLNSQGKPANDSDRAVVSFVYRENPAVDNKIEISTNPIWFITNQNDNTLEVHMAEQLKNQYTNYNPSSWLPYYYYVYKANNPLSYEVEVEYGSSLTLKMILYVMPAGSDDAVMPPEVANIYWTRLGLN